MSFENLNLNPAILRAVKEMGYEKPTEVQTNAIPLVMQGHDLLVSAQTGTGKTGAFMLPALNMISQIDPNTEVPGCKGPRLLVLTPTRELADQVSEAAMTYSKYMQKIKVVSIIGGVSYFNQRRKMQRYTDIIIATPGRLIDYIEQGEIDLRRLQMLVLDEADRMLDMGFREPVKFIMSEIKQAHQTLLFSATVDRSIEELSQRFMKNAKRVAVTAPKVRHQNIEQNIHFVADLASKRKALNHLLRSPEVNQAIIFTDTKRSCDRLAEMLERDGFGAAPLHGDMRQGARIRTLDALRDGKIKFLVATDVAARGIDVQGITHIINHDLPRSAEDYVHRIGRTGRAGAKGTAISLAYHREFSEIRRIEKFIGHQINKMELK